MATNGSDGEAQPRPSESPDARHSMDPYDRIAPWYDLEHDAFTEDTEAYQELLEEWLGPDGAVLEVGSGTGRLLVGLAVLGYRLTGVEPSRAMRDLAARRVAALPERVRRRITLVGGDALAPDLGAAARFDAALFGLNTLAHLLTRSERAASFAVVAEHLRPGGLLILDLDLRGPRAMARALGRAWDQGAWALPTGGEVRHSATAREVRDGVLTLDHTYEVYAPGASEPSERVSSPMRLALLDPSEVCADLEASGYQIAAHYGDYDLRPARARSPRALLVARHLA